ncbi:MAG: UDP-N-acetylmuramoyl-L-alanine--D-glutamate ligase [Alphaproteobacteria bacterium]|nr:UDP-N-acetylmuramoyl-L-alanine--D-glutamate ligase [Alphaproteobacteria bacterium]
MSVLGVRVLDIRTCRNVLIVGYGVSGKSAYEFLKSNGLHVTVYDDGDGNIPDKVSELSNDIDLVVKSPSVPFMDHNCHRIIKQAKESNIPVISAFDVFRLYSPSAKIIAVTGTNGKSTTTALIRHILKKSGVSIEMGGNIGVPYFDMPRADWYVLEMSSYELASSQYLDFEMACVLNIEPDHMGFHGNFENYVSAKHRALDNAKLRFISYEDQNTLNKYASQSNVITISTENEPKANIYTFENTVLSNYTDGAAIDLSGLGLPGKHNYQNIEFAYAVCKQFGLQSRVIMSHVMSFTPLPHRLNTVRRIGNIVFVNDSKATNPMSSAGALAAFEGYRIYWLVGGRSKKVDPMPYIGQYLPNVRKIYLFGEATDEFVKVFHGRKATKRCETMSSALNLAYKDASVEHGATVILLSPMCASFDQFESFEHRGNEFVSMVHKLK